LQSRTFEAFLDRADRTEHGSLEQVTGRVRAEQREQVRMLEIRGDLDLRREAVDADDRTEIGSAYFERNAAIVAEVPM
jgi:hypothetical protein